MFHEKNITFVLWRTVSFLEHFFFLFLYSYYSRIFLEEGERERVTKRRKKKKKGIGEIDASILFRVKVVEFRPTDRFIRKSFSERIKAIKTTIKKEKRPRIRREKERSGESTSMCTSNSLTYDNRRRLCWFSVSGQKSWSGRSSLRPVITGECEKGGPDLRGSRKLRKKSTSASERSRTFRCLYLQPIFDSRLVRRR